MSETFELVCDETRRRVWIGQGHGDMGTLYSGEDHTMEALKAFLNDHRNTPIMFINDDSDTAPNGSSRCGYADYECAVGSKDVVVRNLQGRVYERPETP